MYTQLFLMFVPRSYLLLTLRQYLHLSATVVGRQKCHTFLTTLLTFFFPSMNQSTESEGYCAYLFFCIYMYQIYMLDLLEM